MTSNKMFAVMVATMMVAVGFFAVIQTSDESDATATGSYRVFYYSVDSSQNSIWQYSDQQKYDLCQAIEGAITDLNLDIIIDNAQTCGPSQWNQHPNENYGTISSVNDSTDFTVFVYDNRDVNNVHWEIAQTALGWYRCFEDYADVVTFPDSSWNAGASAGTANVAICEGNYLSIPTANTGNMTVPSGMKSLTGIVKNTDFSYTFGLKANIGAPVVYNSPQIEYKFGSYWLPKTLYSSDITGGITIRGYGSDAYLALRDAVDYNAITIHNVVAQEITFVNHDNGTPTDTSDDYYTYYSWFDKVFNLETVKAEGTDQIGHWTQYTYWGSYSGTLSTYDPYTDYLSFSLGYYSIVSDAFNNAGYQFSFVYFQDQKYYN